MLTYSEFVIDLVSEGQILDLWSKEGHYSGQNLIILISCEYSFDSNNVHVENWNIKIIFKFYLVLILLLNQFNRCLSNADLSDDWQDLQSVVDEMNGYADIPRPSVEDYLNGMRANVFYDFFYDTWIKNRSKWFINYES